MVARCLAKRPDQRFQSACDLPNALRTLAGGQVEKTTSPLAPRRGTENAAASADSEFPARPCVAVLPLQNFSANKTDTGYIVDGMTEVLIAELARNRALRVVSRTTVMQFKDSQRTLRPIARNSGPTPSSKARCSSPATRFGSRPS